MNAIVAYWKGLSRREQRLMGVAGAVLVLGVLYWGIISHYRRVLSRHNSVW